MQIKWEHLVGTIIQASKSGELSAFKSLSSIMKHHYADNTADLQTKNEYLDLSVLFEKMSKPKTI